ncbi:hypothetical protein EOK75_11000 [Pseudorhodobacter turbinis]|uniref:Uncharacterized protein n=1 Tax=Pseudorhodobacter turbinis TaxID=2500533 RepID=A0A4P8EH79_9RHOB|nr:hypothetical protein [Pseudorhodobacter turbinis]QCO56209.1 hypothetical protein EOK75_11000 [Pseudorhodobacter turbinis]
MSIWISKVCICAFLVSGCVAPGTTKALQSGQVARKDVAISGIKLAGPVGFCPLTRTRQKFDGAEFVAFAPCDGSEGPILAATVGPNGSAKGVVLTKASLAPFFKTLDGKAALRGAGNNDDIIVHDVRDIRGGVTLGLTRSAEDKENESWRTLMAVGERLITLSVRPRQDKTISNSEGRRQIDRFAAAVRRANGL